MRGVWVLAWLRRRMESWPCRDMGKGEAEARDMNDKLSLGFTLRASAARPSDKSLEGDIRFLWWALSEVRSLTKENMEVIDCSGWGDAIFASLLATRMMPCEAHYLYVKRKHHDALKFRRDSGADCVTVPILDGKIPQCNPYDLIIIDPVQNSASVLKQVLAHSLWRFSRVFVRHGDTKIMSEVYKSMKTTMEWSKIPHTSIIHGCMSKAWLKMIAPPS